MQYLKRIAIIGLPVALCSLHFAAFAQDSACPAIVQAALERVDSGCEETARNQACYGNLTLAAEPQEAVEDFVFDTPGDLANVADIRSLTLDGMNEATGEWGISLMKIQANLPDTLPGQNVTMLLFGDVEIENAMVDSSEDGAPMQAFYFRSGIGDAPCSEAPESGLLIQTPAGAGVVNLAVNEVDLVLGSTAFLQAAAGDFLYVTLLEGRAQVTAFDETKVVLAGTMVSVPIDENLRASGPPTAPEPYAAEVVEMLSGMVEVLPEAVTPFVPESSVEIEPVTDESGACTVTSGGSVNLRSGPGTMYARAGGLAANESANPVGQVEGIDGYTWWQLADGSWVRSDVVETSGNCYGVPIITDLPPAPITAPAATSNRSGDSAGDVRIVPVVSPCPQSVPAGYRYYAFVSTGQFAAPEIAINAVSFTVAVNGQPLTAVGSTFLDAVNDGVGQYFDAGMLAPGTYAINHTHSYSTDLAGVPGSGAPETFIAGGPYPGSCTWIIGG